MDWMKVLSNLYHMGLVCGSSYIAAYPEGWAWLLPVLQMYGQTLPPPNFEPVFKVSEVPRA